MRRRAEQLQIDIVAALPALRTLARCYTTDPDYAEDLVVVTLVEALGNTGTFHPDEDPSCWLLARLRQLVHKTAGTSAGTETTEPSSTAADFMALPIEVREVAIMQRVLGLSDEQIARICGYSIGRALELRERGIRLMGGASGRAPPSVD